SCPLKKSWKLRCRRARPAACQRNLGLSAAGALLATFSGMGSFESATFTSLMMTDQPAHHYIVTVPMERRNRARSRLFHRRPEFSGQRHLESLAAKPNRMNELGA